MRIIADLHIHSRYSRACSTELSIANLEKWARVKGIDLLGTGDFSHPKWIEELKRELTEDGSGILKTKSGFPFVLQNEISLVYTQGDKGRRVHLVLLAPSFAVVDKITAYLLTKGRIDYDGRPIFKISCIDFTKELKKISDDIEIIPAHIWTPWFGLFGSKTGFDSVEEAFGDQAKHIHALETGLSSDPEMNRLLSNLDKFQMVSFSDSHSFWPWRLGREATIFEMKELSYAGILKALRTGDGLAGTVEVDPGYGKYHFDGHRDCKVSFSPEESKHHNKTCPVCKKPLTIGVLYRVDELADRKRAANTPKFYRLIPLHDIIAFVLDTSPASKKAWAEYYNVLKAGNDEFDILLNVPKEKLLEVTSAQIADLIMRNREGKLEVKPGYDGEYGALTVDGVCRAVESDGASEEKEKSAAKEKKSKKSDDKQENEKEQAQLKKEAPAKRDVSKTKQQAGLRDYF